MKHFKLILLSAKQNLDLIYGCPMPLDTCGSEETCSTAVDACGPVDWCDTVEQCDTSESCGCEAMDVCYDGAEDCYFLDYPEPEPEPDCVFDFC
jgi:hypothetical protein